MHSDGCANSLLAKILLGIKSPTEFCNVMFNLMSSRSLNEILMHADYSTALFYLPFYIRDSSIVQTAKDVSTFTAQPTILEYNIIFKANFPQEPNYMEIRYFTDHRLNLSNTVFFSLYALLIHHLLACS